MSILGWVLIGILVLAEAKNYMTPKFKEHMIVDTSLGQQLRVNINITFHSLTCNEVQYSTVPYCRVQQYFCIIAELNLT